MNMPTKDQIVAAATECPDAKKVLVKLFPEAFVAESISIIPHGVGGFAVWGGGPTHPTLGEIVSVTDIDGRQAVKLPHRTPDNRFLSWSITRNFEGDYLVTPAWRGTHYGAK